MITYSAEYKVFIDGVRVGTIEECYGAKGYGVGNRPGEIIGYRYYPKGQKTGGDLYPTLAACKQSLEN